MLKSCNGEWSVLVTLRREFETKHQYSIVGVDVGVRRLAAISVVTTDRRILRQFYFGQDLGHKKREICLRREKLGCVDWDEEFSA